MSLPESPNPISISQILVELDRDPNSSLSLDDIELLELAGKNLGEPINFPQDFHGKSNTTPYLTTITLGLFSGFYLLNDTIGDATPRIVNNTKILHFGQSNLSGFPAIIDFTGRFAAFELKKIEVDTDGDGELVTQIVTPASLKATSQIGTPILDYSGSNFDNPFNVTLFFSKEYLFTTRFVSGVSNPSQGVTPNTGVFDSDALTSFVYNTNTYNVVGIYTFNSTSFYLQIDNNGNPELDSNTFSKIRICSASYYDFADEEIKPEILLEFDMGSVDSISTNATFSNFIWDTGVVLEGDRKFDVVIIK